MNYSVNYSKMIESKYASCFTVVARNADLTSSENDIYTRLKMWCIKLNELENSGHTFTDVKYSGFIAVPSPKSDNGLSKADVTIVVYSDASDEPKTSILRVKNVTYDNMVSNLITVYQTATGHTIINTANDYIVNAIITLHN